MNPTAKNLKKLAQVPFFKGFTKEQLHWVDEHTDEYGFSTGETIPTDNEMKSVYWILLYGAMVIDGKRESQRITDLGSWFQYNQLGSEDFIALKAASTSFILMVSEQNMIKMKEMNYPLPEGVI